MKEHTRNTILVICSVVLVIPLFLGYSYADVDYNVMGVVDSSADIATLFKYTNATSGTAVSSSQITEVILTNGTFQLTVPTLTDQDTDEWAQIWIQWSPTTYTLWEQVNTTSFDTTTSEYCTAYKLGIEGADEALTGGTVFFGWSSSPTERDRSILGNGFALADGTDKIVTMSVADMAYMTTDEFQARNAAYSMVIRIDEPNANLIVSGEVMTVTLEFYSGNDVSAFENNLLIMAGIQFCIALGMTKMIDLTPHHRFRSYRPRRESFRRFSRYRPYRRPYRGRRFRRPRFRRYRRRY